MECKKCSNLNFLISQSKHDDAVELMNDYLTMFQRDSIVPFEHTVFKYFCKFCFNLYTSELKSDNYDHNFVTDKFSTQDGELLKNLAYSFTLFNLIKGYQEYHAKMEKVDMYFFVDSLTPLTDNYSLIDVVRLEGINSPERLFSPKLYPSFNDLLMDLPFEARELQDHVLFKVSLSPKDISYNVDFSDFPSTDILLKTNRHLKNQDILVVDGYGETIGDVTGIDFNDYLTNRHLSFGNELLVLAKDARKNYNGEPFIYNADPKPFLDELVYKYLR